MAVKHKFSLFAASVLALTLSQAEAQNLTMDEVIVTSTYEQPNTSALKMLVPPIDVPQSLSIIDGETIKQRGFAELGDIVRYTAGLNTSQGEGHRDAIVFRGVRSTADFFLDGARDDVQYYRPLYNLEQVEVLRGPNTLLFGRGGTGGAVNRVSKKAMIGKSSSEMDVSIDSFGAYHLAADVNLDTSSKSALRVNAFVDSLENDRDFYYGDRMGINPTYRRAINDQTTFDLSLDLMDHERFIDRGIPTGADGAPVDGLREIVFASPTDNVTTLEATVLRGTLTRQYSDTMTGTVNLHYGDYEKIYRNLYASGYDADAETAELDGYHDPTERTRMVLNGHVTNQFSAGGMNHTLLIGGEYIDTQSENLRYNTQWSTSGNDKETFSLPTAGTMLDLTTTAGGQATSVSFTNASALANQTETDITVTSLFLQDQIAVTEKLQVLLGARVDNVEISITDIKNNNTTITSDDTQTSPRLGLIYKPQSNLSLYASMSESFLPRAGEQYKKLSDALDPDVSENTEFGIKWDVSENLNVAASFFDNEQEKVQSDGQGGGVYVQGLSVDGYELEVKGKIANKTNVNFAFTSLDGETASGKTPRELPETMYSLFVEHQANLRLNFGIGLTYQDTSLIKDGSTAYLPDYTRIDASLSYAMENDMTLRVNIENLTDEDYYPHAHSTHQASVGEPMNAKISLSRKF